MPHSKSAEKRLRQNQSRHLRNKAVKSLLHTLTKKFLAATENNNPEEAEKIAKDLTSAFRKAAHKGIIHDNNANRHISRLNKRLLRLRKKAKEK